MKVVNRDAEEKVVRDIPFVKPVMDAKPKLSNTSTVNEPQEAVHFISNIQYCPVKTRIDPTA